MKALKKKAISFNIIIIENAQIKDNDIKKEKDIIKCNEYTMEKKDSHKEEDKAAVVEDIKCK